VRVAARIGSDDDTVGAELTRDRGRAFGPALLVGRALLVAAHEDDACEAQRLSVLAVERANELIALKEPGRVAHRGPVVLPAGDPAVEHLGRIHRARQACLAAGTP
jgi:hypothetical protein